MNITTSIYVKMLILGIHVGITNSTTGENYKTLDNALTTCLDTYKINAAQIFVWGPQVMRANNTDGVKECTKDIDLSVHSAYPTVGIWKNENYELLDMQLEDAASVSASSFVIHLPCIKPESIADIMKNVLPLAKKNNICINLEMLSSKAKAIGTYEDPHKINTLIDCINNVSDQALLDYYGITIDTAHLWGAGVDIKHAADMQQWLDALKYPNKIKQIHLNGSSTDIGSGKDKHEIACSSYDNIWYNMKYENTGLSVIIEFAVKRSIPIICEINRGDETDMIKLIKRIKRHTQSAQ